jgi:hypothetical protein
MDAGESAGLGANDGLWVGIVDGSPAGVALKLVPRSLWSALMPNHFYPRQL